MADDDYEETLLIVPECYVYKIPPRTNAQGYKAADWNIQSFIWSGRLTVKAKGDDCVIKLEDPKDGKLFACCPVRSEQSVEKVIDSSRYFVMRIEDGQGHHAFIGMGFTERDQAFDFKVALQDHAQSVQRRKELAESRKNTPAQDFSLKEGQVLRVKIKTGKAPSSSSSSTSSSASLSGGFLPPPPGSNKHKKKKSAKKSAAPQQWGEFTSATSAPSSTTGNNPNWSPF
eukprot:TRINITY_DN2053_c0_g2_i1.p1 TRINITY_DN2053_c0_g2~~TRINITY_DN2053_c0_g2_i1.p1  ORF type:complete len:229 (-),score=49.90 TRINITY_DN2053_c0_g2_i1:11-697(-)